MADDADEQQEKPLTGSALRRGARLAGLPAGFAARTTWGIGRRLVGAPASAVMNDVQRRTADQVFSVLGQLKGGAMKFGQALSIFEAALPEEIIGPYREALTKLQDAAPPMGPGTVTRVMEREFGADWADRFPDFELTPAAAASIGQVHHSWYLPDPDEEPVEVAVKIQYPGAGEALTSDLRQIGRLARMLGTMMPNLDVKALVRELQERVAEELDYGLEADAQATFADAFEDDPMIVVPRPLEHSERALVTDWLPGDRSLADVIANGTQDERDLFGETYVRFLFEGPIRAGLLHADPHPGNFRILPDGRLGVVDYGAVARLPDGLPAPMGPLLRAAADGDYATVADGLRQEGFLRDGQKLDPDVLERYLSPLVEPIVTETFTFDRDWLRRQTQRLAAPGQEGMSTALKLNVPPGYLLIHRVWAGGIGVLCQLGSTAHFRAIVADSLPGFDPA
ncbi:ABC1 kinase family protein [Aeromicrobium duanguangcaii]|uniref:AarF/ABC1/UbiB kinase family protein n=1 Tax=Aeromicrobium duanguangcaii TaxID=2968086 RepID=A0ABY5KEH2_9ACTN|nr:AarF/ABC1/UbiB kinase family protein [Aeromicrobium duanguangcaii]MCD9154745.1 AarF/ABC1/UbiB kinase family protein [Aeromicrobium duanguangcaii]UUI67841.1 AarF/ABC1/UbiB kinase family protein [Aeromicrobium duanguangcaii]